METLFLNIVNMSMTASWIILAVLFLRLIFHKAPKSYRILLWGLVAIRLICPISLESIFSLVPNTSIISNEMLNHTEETMQHGFEGSQLIIYQGGTTNTIPNTTSSQVFDWTSICMGIWLVGMILMATYCIYSYVKLFEQTKESIHLEKNIYMCDRIQSPFILGFIKPKIYVPAIMNDIQEEIILEHEYTHIKHKDYFWKPLGYLILTIHWFNPLVWISYHMLCKDIELACDEKVIQDKSLEEKKLYSNTLLDFSTRRYSIMLCPVAFGEISVKERINAVLHYKKPTVWIIVGCILVSIILSITLMTNPKTKHSFIAQVTEIKESGIVVCELTYESYDYGMFYIPNSAIDEEVLEKITQHGFVEIFPGDIVYETYPARFNEIHDVKICNETDVDRLVIGEGNPVYTIIINSEEEYADIRNAQKIDITTENFNTYFEIEEIIGWGNGEGYPFCQYALVLKDDFQLANAENTISYTYDYDVVKRFYSGQDSSDLTWINSVFLEKRKGDQSYTTIGPRMSFGDELDSLYKTEMGKPYVHAKENITMTKVEGCIYVVDKREMDPNIEILKKDLAKYDNQINISDYTSEDEPCAHPRGLFVKDNINIQITGEHGIFPTYYLDITNIDTSQVYRMYFDEDHYMDIQTYLEDKGFIKKGDY